MRTLLLPLLLPLLFSCQEYAEQTLTPGQKKKVEASFLKERPKPQHEVGAIIENQLLLIGYDIDKTRAKPGETVTVTYYLEALAEKMADNMIFTHFQGKASGRTAWMNLDHHPVQGLLPLRQMKKGQIIKDVQSFTIKKDFPGGKARLYWGLWRGNYRLKIKNAEKIRHDKEGRVILASVNVLGKPAKKKPLSQAKAAQLLEGEQITVDGQLNEPVWSRAPYTQRWTRPDGSGRLGPETRARFAWSPQHLYVAVEAVDKDIWSTFTERDSNTWEQEVIELFIDADGDKKDYLELQVTPANVIFDALFAQHRSDLAKARAWNMEGFQTAVHLDGTLNQREDSDKGYVVEMAIPVVQVPGAKTLSPGQSWRLNLFRWDLPKSGRQQAAAFSPPIVGDFHALNRFGFLHFQGAAGGQK